MTAKPFERANWTSFRTVEQPHLIDNDRGAILVVLDGRQVRGWSYQTDDERRLKMRIAREYIQGWMDGSIRNAPR